MTALTSHLKVTAIRSADAVVVMNTAMLEHVRQIRHQTVIKAPPGVDVVRFAPLHHGWRSDGYLLSVCRLGDERKGIDRLIRAYAELAKLLPKVPALVLAGRGTLPSTVLQLLDSLTVGHNVVIRSDVQPEQLPGLYAGASVYVQASHEEGLGISVLEAMACGLPVVCTDTDGTRDTVVDGETGFVVSQEPASDVPQAIAGRIREILEGRGAARDQVSFA